jgi:fatty-acyl-CoA synthase
VPAVIHADTGARTTYAELEERSVRLAGALAAAGLAKGDVVAVLTDNSPQVFEVYWAVLRSGMYITAINHHLAPGEAAYIVNDSGAGALIASAGKAELAAAVAPLADGVKLRLAFGGGIEGYESYDAALASASPAPPADQPRGADMLYSSGTTGRPKGIKGALPDRQVSEEGDPYLAAFGSAYGFDSETVYLSPAPIYHAAPLRFGGMVQMVGGTVILMHKFDATEFLRNVEHYQVTHTQVVPTMFVRMLKLAESERSKHDVSSLRVAVHAAAPCPVDVKQAMIDWWGPILHEYYSSTEGNGVTLIDSAAWQQKLGSVGRAALGTLRICDDDGTELPIGEAGTVYFERETTPFGYHNDPEKTEDAQHPAHPNWTTTGDIGYVDSDGYLFLTDRKAFMIISGGVNIYPQEVEDCLTMHPKVYDVAVIGLPDADMGEYVQAVVAPAEDAAPGEALEKELLEHARERIAGYKCPRSVDFTTDMPRSETGKLVKKDLRKRYVS